jgi:hypothetical protein
MAALHEWLHFTRSIRLDWSAPVAVGSSHGRQFPWWAALHFRRAKWWLATSPGEMVIKKSTVLEQLFPSPSRTKAIGVLCVEEAIPVPHGRSLKGTGFSQF